MLGTPEERYSMLYDELKSGQSFDPRLLDYMLKKCELHPSSDGFEDVLQMLHPNTTRLIPSQELRMIHPPFLTEFSTGKRLNEIARRLVVSWCINLTPNIRGYMRGLLHTEPSSRLSQTCEWGMSSYLTINDLSMLSMTCSALMEDFTVYPDTMLNGSQLNVQIELTKNADTCLRSHNQRLLISAKTEDLFGRIPLLRSIRPKKFDILRKSNSASCTSFAHLSQMLHGQGHTVSMRGFTAEQSLVFLYCITKQGTMGCKISHLELHIKPETRLTYRQNMPAMAKLCDFIVKCCPRLTHLSIIKSSTRETVWMARNDYVAAAFDQLDLVIPNRPDAPVFQSLQILEIDFPEVDCSPFLSFITKFDKLQKITLKRISPVFARRDQLITMMLAANRQTLRFVDLNFGVHHYNTAASISMGVQYLLLTPLVVYSGLVIRVANPRAVECIRIQLVDACGRTTGNVVPGGSKFIVSS